LECEPEAAALFVHASEEGGEVLTLDEFWGGDAQAFIDTACDTSAQIGKTGEEGLDVVIEDLALARELKGAAVEQSDAQAGFQLQDLRADGGLLNAIGNVACGSADTMVFGHVVEQFQMMNIHRGFAGF
jgi:hypothetical protein